VQDLLFKNVGFMWFYHIKKNYSGNPRVMSENEEKKNPPPIPQKVKDILLRW